MATTLTLEEKRTLYRDGYIILRNAVSVELVEAARRRIRAAKKGENLGGEKEMTDLVNASSITPILNEAMGTFDPPIVCQVGVVKAREPGEHFNNLGYRDKDMPYYGAETHADGNITIAAPQEVQSGTPDEIYRRYFAAGPKGDLGRSADVIGHNRNLLVAELPDQLVKIRGGGFGVVTVQRLVRISESPHIRDNYLVAFRQDWNLVAPAIPELGPTLEEDHRRSLPFDYVMNIDPIYHCHAMFPLIG